MEFNNDNQLFLDFFYKKLLQGKCLLDFAHCTATALVSSKAEPTAGFLGTLNT